MNNEFSPRWCSPPGETISRLLEGQDLPFSHFCESFHLSPREGRQLLEGRLRIEGSLAEDLANLLGGSADFWLERDRQYIEDEAKLVAGCEQTESEFMENLPISDMVKYGWIEKRRGVAAQFAELQNVFELPTIWAWSNEVDKTLGDVVFREAEAFTSNRYSVFAWLRKCELDADEFDCEKWDPTELIARLPEIRQLTRKKTPDSFMPKLVEECEKCGVAVVVNRAPKNCSVSAATKFLVGNRAMIAMTFRYLSDDQFWFSLFHEIGHLILHGRDRMFLEGGTEESGKFEGEADEFAARTLIPMQYQERLFELTSRSKDIIRFAREVGVAPGIVVGQLQYIGVLDYKQQNRLKRRYVWR